MYSNITRAKSIKHNILCLKSRSNLWFINFATRHDASLSMLMYNIYIVIIRKYVNYNSLLENRQIAFYAFIEKGFYTKICRNWR